MSEPTSDASPETQPSAATAEDAAVPPPANAAEARALRNLVRWVAVEVFLYVVVALGLIFLALRRGRLSDAILVLLTLLITTPMILGYRQQALERLRGPRRKKGAKGKAAPAEAVSTGESQASDSSAPPPPAG